jgi:hypothetical protein
MAIIKYKSRKKRKDIGKLRPSYWVMKSMAKSAEKGARGSTS